MNNEFEPIPGSLPPEGPANKKIEEIIYPERSEEVDGDKWTPNQQPPINTSLPETNISPQHEQDIADATNEIARGLVNDDLNIRPPLRTEMPDKVVSESPLNEPKGTESIGEFGQIEQRAFDELKNKAKEPSNPGWVGTSFVDPDALRPKPQVAAAPPPPSSPPSGPPSGPPPPYDKNKMPDGVYDKASLKPTNEFPEEGVDNIIPAESYDTKPNQTETIEEVIDAESSKYKNNFPPEPEKP